MKDAFGGILNLALISVFLLIVSGVLGFTVSYTKAFRMKNIVIDAFERYDSLGCLSGDREDSACKSKIEAGAESIHYAPNSLNCPNDYENMDGLFCYKESNSLKDTGGVQHKNVKTFRIITQVDINIPIINKIMGLRIFQVSGDTRELEPTFNN